MITIQSKTAFLLLNVLIVVIIIVVVVGLAVLQSSNDSPLATEFFEESVPIPSNGGSAGTTTPVQSVTYLASGENHTLIVLSHGALFSSGDNTYGQLGVSNDPSNTQRVTKRSKFEMVAGVDGVRFVACGANHNLIYCVNPQDNTSQVFAFGLNSKYQLGFTTQSDSWYTPHEIESLRNISVLSLRGGEDFSMILTVSGNVYVFGNNASLRLGSDQLNPDTVQIPLKIYVQVSHIACGARHIVLIVNSQHVFVSGLNDKFQWGDKNTHNPAAPLLLHSFDEGQVAQVECGQFHTVIRLVNGQTWGFGNNETFQFSNTFQNVLAFTNLTNMLTNASSSLSIVKWIACGQQHTIFVDHLYHLYACGAVLSPSANYWTTVVEVGALTDFKNFNSVIAAGQANTLIQNSADTTSLNVLGNNSSGQLGLANTQLISKVTLVNFQN